MKSVKRRSVEAAAAEQTASVAPRLSENISLFQSLRVLQEGEEDSELAPKTGMTLIVLYVYLQQKYSL